MIEQFIFCQDLCNVLTVVKPFVQKKLTKLILVRIPIQADKAYEHAGGLNSDSSFLFNG